MSAKKLVQHSPTIPVGKTKFCITRPPRSEERRGVLLLVILSLLILFVMIAVTYVLVAAKHLQTSKNYARVATTGDTPQHLLDGAMGQVLRGSQNLYSVIYPHSLLEDFYGGPAGQPLLWAKVGPTVSKLPASLPGQILEFDALKAPRIPRSCPALTIPPGRLKATTKAACSR